ncbi:bone morphogenetic protein 2-B [Austrofundulus limnaeus]|uniref:Bone morphogenetic protein 2-B n=1 Tax=Austrofundulus limnaeus TaxID=52670 RepID=A0A2I4C7R2_AUSLI|nr:PREDICTED: bone morphogenetic protein 2-B-like [Austrofundulus limnaeus]
MLDLFNSVSGSGDTQRSQEEILEGNIVRSLEAKGHTGEKILFFNLSSLDREETIIKAELRWFRKKPMFDHRKLHSPHIYQVNLYEVLDSRVKPQEGDLITSRLVPVYTQGWEVFNTTQIVSKWIQKNLENTGILVETSVPFTSWRKWVMSSINQPAYTYLLIFSDDGRTKADRSQLAAIQTKPQHRLSRRRRASSDFSSHGRPQSCQRVPLFVDFKEIGWSGWIISPHGYNAYQCRGSCPFPLGDGLRATNHATVRSIMHALKLSSSVVGAPCCVPNRLQSISLLYFDDEENVVLKQFDDMVALSCGCH